jgi:hypothetical protein
MRLCTGWKRYANTAARISGARKGLSMKYTTTSDAARQKSRK